jgi:hypothetical protein
MSFPMFKKSPQKGGSGGGRGGAGVATIPENESLRETDNLLLQHHHSSMDLIPVTDSISHSLGSLDAQRLGGSPSPPASSQQGGGGIAATLGISTGTVGSSSSSKGADASGAAAVKMAPPTNDLSPKNSTLKMMRLWDVSMGPFKKTMVGGVLVPNALAPVQFLRWTKRRVTLELYGETSAAAASSPTPASSGPPIAEIVTDAEAPSSQKDHAGASDKFALSDSDVLYLRIYKQHHQHRRRRIRMGGGNNNAGSSEDDDNLSVVDTDDDDASLISGIPDSCTFLLCRSYEAEKVGTLKTHTLRALFSHPC